VVNAPTQRPVRREHPFSARVAAVCDVDRADLVALVLELADLLDVEDVTPGPGGDDGPRITRALVDGVWVVDMADELSAEARTTFAEVLRATDTVVGAPGSELTP
jgi:hypothetical protein